MADGAGGGREEGDVELALFRRSRPSSDSLPAVESDAPSSAAPGPAPYRPFARYPYARDPLSMFSAARDRILSRAASRRDIPAIETAEEAGSSGASAPTSTAERALTASVVVHEAVADTAAGAAGALGVTGPQPVASSEEDYRAAMERACADLLGKTLEDLQEDYEASGGAGKGDIAPRDFADYAIMTALKTRDAFAIHNAPSWLFTVMDRSGAGYVLREEFVKYAPFMAPVADAAVAATVFDELIRAQVAAAQKPEPKTDKNLDRRGSRRADCASSNGPALGRNKSSDSNHAPARELYPISAALRYPTWKRYFDSIRDNIQRKDEDWERVKRELGLDPSERLIKAQGAVDHSDMWPTLGKLFLTQRYLVFFAAVGRNHYVGRLGAVTNVGTKSLPILMRDCFTIKLESEATSAMNGVSAPVDATTLLSRSATKRPRSRSKVAGNRPLLSTAASVSRVGGPVSGAGTAVVAASVKEAVARVAGLTERKGRGEGMDEASFYEEGAGGRDAEDAVDEADDLDADGPDIDQNESRPGGWSGNELPLPQHAQRVMKQFTEGGKPLVFSFIELRDTRHRDLWLSLVKEMADAHRLHLKLGFGSSGRVIPEIYSGVDPKTASGIQVLDGLTDPSGNDGVSEFDNSGESGGGYMTYLLSPFRNEPPPPLLAVAAHANVFRYCAIKDAASGRDPVGLLVFSHPERFSRSVTWYVDSVRAHDDRSGRSWIERAFGAIRENMELNKRVYHVQTDEPFDVARFGEGIGRLAELCTPVARLFQFFSHLVQWRNPAATVLALLASMCLVYMGWVKYLPSAALLFQAGLIVATRNRMFGLDGWMWGGGRPEDARQRQANVLELVAHVHGTLRAAQNVIKRLNHALGKVQTLCLWGADEEWKSWVFVGMLSVIGFLLATLPARFLFAIAVFMLFSRHFMPPRNLGRRFWASVPARVVTIDPAAAVAGASGGTAGTASAVATIGYGGGGKKRR
jgi:hypothetical protein